MDLGSWNGTYISHDEPMLEPVDFDSFLESLQNGDYSRGVEQTPILSTPSDNTDPVSEPPMKKRRRPRTIKSPGKEPIRRRPRKPPPGVESQQAYSIPTTASRQLQHSFIDPDFNSSSTGLRAPHTVVVRPAISPLASAPLEKTISPASRHLSGSSPSLQTVTQVENAPPSVTHNFLGNVSTISKSQAWMMVKDPASGKILTRVPESTLSEVQSAVSFADDAFLIWKELPLAKRRSKLFKFLELVKASASEIAIKICVEAGKTMDDANSEVTRAIEMIEAACSVSSGIVGSHLVQESGETYTIQEPLGVCLSITPFNFPFLVPLWSIPFALITGNTVVWKPSELCPSVAMMIASYFVRADFPPGVINIVHGGPNSVDKLLAQPSIRAVSFVGSDIAAERVYEHAIATRKRIQADCGSKNHGVVMPDADKERTLYTIAGSAFGAAGQRCMALSVVIFIGSTASWIDRLVEIASELQVGCGLLPEVNIGPLITPAAKERVVDIIRVAAEEGATLLLDGRKVSVPSYPNGNFVGPTILSNVKSYMQCYQIEIFGPVLACMTASNLDEAISIINDNKYGNGCSIFTTSNVSAQTFQRKVNVGQIGLNVPVLASPGQFPRTSNKDSFLGDMNTHSQPGWQFFTMTKTITSLWREPR